MIILVENQVGSYQELWADEVVSAVEKGDVVLINDVLCFYFADAAAGSEIVPVWWAKQVRATKGTGSNTGITRGQQVYYQISSGNVTANPTGSIGTDYYFIGICKKTASESDTTVLMSYWGDEYNHADRAA
jgi:predicted RecA/RadA family phage recombinase